MFPRKKNLKKFAFQRVFFNVDTFSLEYKRSSENAFERVILSNKTATNKLKRVFKEAFKPSGKVKIWTSQHLLTFSAPLDLLETSGPSQDFFRTKC
jgi:hypothetical protein